MQQQINVTKNVTIEFTPDQLSVVMDYLHNSPGSYNAVAGTIKSIENQIIKQLTPPPKDEKELLDLRNKEKENTKPHHSQPNT